MRMRINEIFSSIAGEVNLFHQGVITTFIRFQGCNLRCPYCDTPETQSHKNKGIDNLIDIYDVIDKVKFLGNRVVCLTGGEPLLRNNGSLSLIQHLAKDRYKIVVETNGTIDIRPYLDFVNCFVIDYKIHSTTEMEDVSFYSLRNDDVVKIPVQSREEIRYAFEIQEKYVLGNYDGNRPLFAISPIFHENNITSLSISLIQEMIEKYCKFKERTVISVQLHKLLGVK